MRKGQCKIDTTRASIVSNRHLSNKMCSTPPRKFVDKDDLDKLYQISILHDNIFYNELASFVKK